jgi:hypothetical protein
VIAIYKAGASASAHDVRLPMSYGGLTFNDPGGKIMVDMVAINPAWDWVLEAKAQRDGMESYEPKRMNTIIRLEGIIRGDSIADLFDQINAVNAAFDPVLNYTNDSSYDEYVPRQQQGYTPFAFQCPTADLTLAADGVMDLRYFARSRALPVPRVSKFEGFSTRWSAILECVDPRAYFTDTQSVNAVITSSMGGTEVDNARANYPSWPILTIVPNVNPTGDVTIQMIDPVAGISTLSLEVDSIVVADDEVVVDFEAQRVTLNGTERMDLLVPGAEWFMVPPGTSHVAISNTAPGWNLDTDTIFYWTPARV